MAREWKNHKYIRKEGKRYFYKSAKDITGIESPDLTEFSDSLENVSSIKKIRDILRTPIYSPNKEDKTLISSAKESLNNLINQHKDEKLFAGGK